MKSVLAYAAACMLCTIAAALSSCQADQELNPTEPDITAVSSKTAGILVSRPAKITQTYTKGKGCSSPKRDCFETIVITANRPNLVAQIGNLDGAISGGSTSSFFSSPANYSAIWSGIPTKILSDLKSGTAILQKVAGLPSDRREYHVVNSQGQSIDYSAVE